jgi:hypothetical protein
MISVNITYYNEPTWLKWWYKKIIALNDIGLDIRLNIGDDGSMEHPAEEFFNRYPPTDSMRLFRVKEDLGFNSHGTRNLLMKQTETEWNLLSDIDRHYPLETFKTLARGDLEFTKGSFYSLKEIIRASHDGFSVNDYIVHRDDFWHAGGYDEELVNVHWGDRLFLDCLRRLGQRITRDDIFVKYVRFSREVTFADVPKTLYSEDENGVGTLVHPIIANRWGDAKYRADMRIMIAERNKSKEARLSKPTINFEWERIF